MKPEILLPIIGMLMIGALVYSGFEWNSEKSFKEWASLHGKKYSQD